MHRVDRGSVGGWATNWPLAGLFCFLLTTGALSWRGPGSREALAEEQAEAPAERVLGPSLKDRAVEALTARRLDEARDLYGRWLEADPRDGTSWYNLACVEALSGKSDEALEAFENAVRVGFDQLEHARTDADLAAVRESPRFGRALALGLARRAADNLPGLARHALSTETVGSYIVLLPPDYALTKRTYPVVVILHGSGSTELAHARVSADLGREGVIYVAPRALHPHMDVFMGAGRPGWTAWPAEKDEAEEAPDPMALHTDWVLRCVDDVGRRYRAASHRVAVWGHSQGAAGACILAARHPERVSTLFAYAGYYPDVWYPDETLTTWKQKALHVELAHGISDTVVDPEGTKAMRGRLEGAGVSNAVHLLEAQHGLTADVRRLSKRWVDSHVRAASPAPVR